MKYLDLTKYFNLEIIFDSLEDFQKKDNHYHLFNYYSKSLFPYKYLTLKGITYNLNNIKRSTISCNKQKIIIDSDNIKAIAFAGATMMFSFKEKVIIVYEDRQEEQEIKLTDMSDCVQNSLPWLFGKQKKEELDYSHILYQQKNNYIYHYVIKINSLKKIKYLILPENELVFIFAITLINTQDNYEFI